MAKYILIFFFCYASILFVQNTNVDSLKIKLDDSLDNEKVEIYLQLSKLNRSKSLDTALIYADQALKLSTKLKNKNAIVQSYKELGSISYLKGESKKAINYCDKGIAILSNEENEVLYGLVQIKGNAFTISGQLDEGLECFRKVLNYWESFKDSTKVASLLNNIGIIHYYKGDYDSSMIYLLKSAEIYDKQGKRGDVADISGNIAQIYNELGNYEKAIEHTLNALDVYEQLDDYYSQAGLLINLSNIYKNIDSLDQSIEKSQKALEIASNNGYTALMSLAFSNLGLAFEKKGLYNRAINAVENSLEIAQKQEDIESEAKNLRFLGSLYSKEKEYNKALLYLNKSESLAEQIHLVSDYYDIYFEKSKIYEALKDYKNSLRYYRKYTQVKDSIFTEEKHKQITEIETKYQTAKKEKELIQLSEENNKQRMIILKSRYFTLGLIVIILFVLLFGFMFIRLNKIRSRQKTLELEQKLFRSQMNPHFIFNSLSSIQYYIAKNKPIEAGAYLSDFAKLMRLVINNSKEEFITLDQEIDTMNYYLQMQQLRFEDNFDYQFEVDKNIETNEVLIPPMLTQPFIENSIEHAFKENKSGNLLQVSYKLHNKHLEILVEDNGIGRAKALANKNSNHKSFAIEVTKRRLEKLNRKSKSKIFFEIIDLQSEEGKSEGTKVRFKLPIFYS